MVGPMCSTCTTAFDAASTNAVLLAAVATNCWERVKDRARGTHRIERDLAVWEQNADFVRSLGLDPLMTLGAPPAVPATTNEPEPRPAPVG